MILKVIGKSKWLEMIITRDLIIVKIICIYSSNELFETSSSKLGYTLLIR